MVTRIILPTRNVLSVVSHQDQRMIRWFEDANTGINGLLSGTGGGAGSILDMGARVGESSLYDGGDRV